MKQANYILIFLCIICFSCGKTDDPKQAFEKGDYETAFKLWLPRAEQGDTDAQNYLGIHYNLGLGVARDYKQALEWYGQAAKAGHPDAQSNYGDMINYGYGIPKDNYKAFVWYFAASQQGHEKAKIQIDAIAALGNLSPNQQMHAKIEANSYITDPNLRFMSHDTYIEK